MAPWRVLGIDKCAAKPKARRRGAVPAEPLGDRLPLFPPRMAFFHWFLPFITPLDLLSRSAMVA